MPPSFSARYLGVYLDQRLTYKEHIRVKKMELDLRLNRLCWLLHRQSALSLSNKDLLYVAPSTHFGLTPLNFGAARQSIIASNSNAFRARYCGILQEPRGMYRIPHYTKIFESPWWTRWSTTTLIINYAGFCVTQTSQH